MLRELGLPVLVENANVGGNLQDHLAVSYYYKATEPTLNNQLAPWWGKALQGSGQSSRQPYCIRVSL